MKHTININTHYTLHTPHALKNKNASLGEPGRVDYTGTWIEEQYEHADQGGYVAVSYTHLTLPTTPYV